MFFNYVYIITFTVRGRTKHSTLFKSNNPMKHIFCLECIIRDTCDEDCDRILTQEEFKIINPNYHPEEYNLKDITLDEEDISSCSRGVNPYQLYNHGYCQRGGKKG